jgi:small subunit ribosomal protein S3
MGQKVHPYGLRLGIVTDWKSRWYSDKDYAAQVIEDAQIRDLLAKELTRGAVSRVEIERIGDKKVQIDIHTARPGVVIGRGGSEVERLRQMMEKLTDRVIKVNVIEVQDPDTDAQLLARSIADQLEGRVSFRRAMKRAVTTAMKSGAQGVRVQTSARLGGADMGRREWYREGRVPLHTLRADVDYGAATATTTVGAIGVKVWVYKGDVVPSLSATREKIAAEAALATGGPSSRRAPAKARAEAAAGDRPRGLIEAGGGRRVVEGGGGKREGGKRLIEAGGGKRLDPAKARSEFQEARQEAEETLRVEEEAAAAQTDAAVAAAADSVAEAVEAVEAVEPVAEAGTEMEPAAVPEPDADAVTEAVAETVVEVAAEPVAQTVVEPAADTVEAAAEEPAEEAPKPKRRRTKKDEEG